MTMSELRPALKTPTGGAESQPQRPEQWHGHPYVWAWNVSLGATSRTYIEGECKAAEDAQAPADAVYRAREDDPSMPGEWVTVGMLTTVERQNRVREYAQALMDWQEALQAYRKPPAVQPPQEAGQPPAEEHEYVIVYRPTHITGVVRATSLLEAVKRLTPGEKFKPSGYGILDFEGENGVEWHVGFDSGKTEILSTTDPRVNKPMQSSQPPATPETAEVPASPEPSGAPAEAVDTAATQVPTEVRGLRVLRRTPQQ